MIQITSRCKFCDRRAKLFYRIGSYAFIYFVY